jgi:hypothetical protein
MERHSFFKEVHKGIRAAAADLLARAGRTDFADADGVSALQQRVEETFALIEAHARTEETFLLPLLRICAPDVAADSEADHRSQSLRLRDLRSALALAAAGGTPAQRSGHAFFVALSRFHGEMLVHMAEEEERQMPALWAAFDDAALRRVHRAVLDELPDAEKVATVRWMLLALNRRERAALFARAAAEDPSPYDSMVRLAREVLSAAEWERLESALATAA